MVLQRYWQPEFQSKGFLISSAVRAYSERLIKEYDVRSGQGPLSIARSMSEVISKKQLSQERLIKNMRFWLQYSRQGAWM